MRAVYLPRRATCGVQTRALRFIVGTRAQKESWKPDNAASQGVVVSPDSPTLGAVHRRFPAGVELTVCAKGQIARSTVWHPVVIIPPVRSKELDCRDGKL